MSDNKLPNNRKGWLTPQQKLVLIHSVDKGRFSVSEACRQANTSRKTFYKWRNRYCAAKAEAAKVFEALSPKKKTYLQRHPCRSADLFATEVLEVVKRNPSLSSREIAKHVCLSMTGVWGVLKRAGLATQRERKRFRRLQLVLKPWLALVFVIEYLLGGVIIPEIPLIYPLLLTIPKERRPTILYIPLLLLILGAGWRFNQGLFTMEPSLFGRVGLVLSEIALIFGMFFFIYSVKYYLTLVFVLASSRRTNGSTNGFSNGLKNGLKNGLNGLNGKNGRLNGFFNGNGRLSGLLNGLKKSSNNNHLNGLNGQLGGFDRLGRWLGLNGLRNGLKNGNGGLNGFLNGHLNGRLNGRPNDLTGLNGNGLNGHDLQKIELKEKPFVSIHLPFYNEKRVAGRILEACSKLNYPNFEVLVVDDSNDGTTEIVREWSKRDPRIKLLHRFDREGWKGGALRHALTKIDPKAQFVVVFDADFIPFPDTLDWFLRYFHFLCGGLRNVAKSKIAAVQGYQWHVLNKDENWITRGVRGEYAGSYIIERSGAELLGSLKQIAGSVYMIRADLLKQFGWGTSITEDFQLTLRLYEQGYKVIYTPYIQAPAECVATIKRLIRQRMRWAEGHTHNVRKMFTRLWYSPKMNLTEKLEFLYLSPYYLQSFLFLVGTLSWLSAEIIFRSKLPFWTATWGWSLVFTNMFSLILMNAIGLFIEESDRRDYQGLLSFLATTYLIVPFQAYAAVKGFFEKEEGHWFRTPKTGLITIELVRGHFARLVGWLLPRRAGERVRRRLASNSGIHSALNRRELKFANPYLALATANNQFSNFKIRPRHIRWIGKTVLISLLIFSLLVGSLAYQVPLARATAGTQIKTVEFFLYQRNSATEITAGNGIDNTAYGATCGSADSDPSVSITIPETSAFFRSAIVEYRTFQSVASGTAATDYDIQFCNSTTTASDSGSGTVTTSSGENNMVVVRLEASSAMSTGTNTYWFDARLVGAARNLDSLKIYITYEYDQTEATQLKTVRYYGTQQTGAGSSSDLDSVINPNLTESTISVKQSWAELWGQVNTGTDNSVGASYAASGTCNAKATVATADGSRTTAYSYLVLFSTNTSINLTSNNCIRHGSSAVTMGKSTEWVITFSYSYYDYLPPSYLVHTKTVKYMMGTTQASLGNTQTNVGTQAINLPENKPSNPFTSVYVRYMSNLDTVSATFTTCISTGAACTGTTSSQSSITYGISKTGGGFYALDDVTAFFNTNWSNGTSFSVSAACGTTSDCWGTSAELIITYWFNADTSSTIAKTVYFWVGQETLSQTNTTFNQASEATQANFNTWWPESGTKTFRNGAVYGAFDWNGITGVPSASTITATITVDDLSVGGTDAATIDTRGSDENMTREMMVKISTQVPATFAAQSDINFSMTTNSTTLPVFRSPIAYFTVETATSLAPEFAFIFIPLAIFLPPVMKIYLDNKKRGLNNG